MAEENIIDLTGEDSANSDNETRIEDPAPSPRIQSGIQSLSDSRRPKRVVMKEKKIKTFLEQVHGFDQRHNNVIEIKDDDTDDGSSAVEVLEDQKLWDTNQTQNEVVNANGSDPIRQIEEGPKQAFPKPKPKRFKPHKRKRSKSVKASLKQSATAANLPNMQKKIGPSSSTRKESWEWRGNDPTTERRYIFHQSNNHRTTSQRPRYFWEGPKTSEFQKNFGFTVSEEDVLKDQEKLFKESAARMRCQAYFQVVSHSEHKSPCGVRFNMPVFDIHKRYPNHWQYRNPYARLGLPNDAAMSLVKLQFRKLALVYHPDKSRSEGTANKFQAVTEAYKTLSGE